jgi:hypothetical protein
VQEDGWFDYTVQAAALTDANYRLNEKQRLI